MHGESGSKRWEKGLAKAGNARVRRGLIQLAWRFLRFQNDSALAQWFRARIGGGERMSKHAVRGGDTAGRLARFALASGKGSIAHWRDLSDCRHPRGRFGRFLDPPCPGA
ncbi:transposase [Mesorhizobium sp.]|uniref:transposase n=1 Tax=Mesorhizobium sp. TaxID=1871066 RepID=UPI0025D40324|nr:transposase [Mesorhizobium sp.]